MHKSFKPTPRNIISWSDYEKRFSFEPDGKLQNQLFDKKITLSMEDCCLDRCRKIVNISSFYGNGGGYVHQSNDTVWDFHLHLFDSKLQNTPTITAHLYTLLARVFEKEQIIRDGTMWYQTDVCAKKYRCSIA